MARLSFVQPYRMISGTPLEEPTAMHASADSHDTAFKEPLAPASFGCTLQVEPFQSSMSALELGG